MRAPLLLLLFATAADAGARARAPARSLASSSVGDGHEAWTGEGLFLPADLTERDVMVDGLLPGEQPGKEDGVDVSRGGGDGDGDGDGNGDGNGGGNSQQQQNAGTVGRIFTALLRRARAQERATPNVGGSANAVTRVEGSRTAQRRNATVILSSGPINAAALGTAGAAAVAPAGELARADARAGASTFANAIMSDQNDDPKDLSAAGSSRGSTVAVGGGTRAAGAQTALGTASAAGEQAAQGRAGLGIGPFLVLFNLGTRDGGQQNGGAGSVGIGERASTRLQVASLAEGRKSEQQVELDKLPKPDDDDKEEEKKDETKDDGKEEEEGKKDDDDNGGEEEATTRAEAALRTNNASSPSPSPSPKPPGPIVKATAKKRDKMNAVDAKRDAKRDAKKGDDPQDAAQVKGRLSERCPPTHEEGDGGGDGQHQHQHQQCDDNDDGGYRGGSALRAWADSIDSPALSTTGSGIADINVRAGLTSEAAANRYGYSRGISTGSASATGTRAARARTSSLSFGTGYVVKSTAATARVVERAEGGNEGKDEEGKQSGGGGDGRRL